MLTKYLLEVNKEDNTLLVNSLTGAVDWVNSNELEKVKKGEKTSLFYKLKARGYMLDDEADLLDKVTKYYEHKTYNFTKRLNVLLCLTYSCNLRCVYCFQKQAIHTETKVISIEQVVKALEDVERHILSKFDKQEYVISLFGGEPLQEKTYEIVENVLHLASQKNIFVNVITNGVELDRFITLLSIYRNNLSVQVTLDGVKDIHNKNRPGFGFSNSYDRIVNNITHTIDKGIPVVVRVNTTVESSQYLDNFFNDLEDLGWLQKGNIRVDIAPVTNHFNEQNHKDIYQESNVLQAILKNSNVVKYLGDKVTFTADMFRITGYLRCLFNEKLHFNINPTMRYCEATYLSTYAVGPDSNVYLCTDAIGRENLAAGKYYPQLQLNDEYIEQLKQRSVFSMEKCKDCNIAFFCGGGCPTAALKEYHDAQKGYCGNAKELMADFLEQIELK